MTHDDSLAPTELRDWPQPYDVTGPFIAIRHRAAGSPSVFFGPFDTYAAVVEFVRSNNLPCEVVNLVNPASPYSTWWN